MRVHLYTVKTEKQWEAYLSLDLRVDLFYWAERGKLVVFRETVPLGAANYIVAQFQSETKMDGWKEGQWLAYMQKIYKTDLKDFDTGWEGDNRNEPVVVFEKGIAGRGDSVLEWSGTNVGVKAGMFLGEIQGRCGLQTNEIWSRLNSEAESMARRIRGRALFAHELQDMLGGTDIEHGVDYWRTLAQLAYVRGELDLASGLAYKLAARRFPGLRRQGELRCRRCGSGAAQHHRTACASCGSANCAYCEACLTMGRSRFCSPLLHGASRTGRSHTPAPGTRPRAAAEPQARWRLSPAQHAASRAALAFLQQPCAAAASPAAGGAAAGVPSFLLWAVTGAGKTEMIFPLIAYALEREQQVLIATPRRDVVLELQPRLQQAFPADKLVTLYGGSEERWTDGRIVLSTTHQLMRFWQKFDLVIIDELDAFPYHNNEQLQYAAAKACKPDGKFIFLSATPPEPMQREVRAGRLQHAKVPVRFHRHPLPVPRLLPIKPVHYYLQRNTLPSNLIGKLQHSLDRGAQIFVFITRIKHAEPLVRLLRRYFADIPIAGTSSADVERAEKVLGFRRKETRMLVTTTILERGVTVPRSDVFILDADSSLFDSASLVQMAGRAGRSKDAPYGQVYFCAEYKNRSQMSAIRQIQAMNRLARREGYFQRETRAEGVAEGGGCGSS
ncbi:primosomal protein N' [Paenibacillus sp. CECT 9249]|uniref:DEAD/DEAH box helicase n=1 Tax=Paenibacillus sp. CECT 9249 TaxID=2845385 RepID=UPI001E3F4FA3|nr:helicase-related protein [Paenibacillus sp. CECT 9249]CAH0118024.1 primosomal protein N' [Paenibacillus sp. CECT 9249]